MRRLTFLLFTCLISAIPCLSLEIKGEVLTLEGKPIAETVVLHRLSGNKTLTDESGFFALAVPDAEKIRLEIIHPDYMDEEIVLTAQNLPKKITIHLTPYIRQREEIVVTAMRYPESSSSVPAAETVIPKETLEETMVPNITEGISNLPGISTIGSGGFSLVPNIRGLARRRVLIMIDNARVTSDRRTGPNASFVDPGEIEKIEILRSPSSVFYGSDAIGGVINIFTKKPSMQETLKGKINVKYGSVNQEKSLGFSLEGSKDKTGFYLSFHGNDAENYSSPHGEIPMSKYAQGSLFGKISHMSEKREIHLSFLGTRGYNIGKPNQDSQTKPTWYPLESQNLLHVQWFEKGIAQGELSIQAYLNPSFLETKKETIKDYKSKESYSKTESLNFGFHLSYGKIIGKHLRLNGGTDFYGRFRVKAKNINTYYGTSGEVEENIEEWPFANGKRKDLGIFLSADYFGIKKLDLVGGVRWDFLQLEAIPGNVPPSQKTTKSTWTGFMAGSAKLTNEIVVFANMSKAYRIPSLSELFYTGITGRGSIIAQPNLKPETSLNLDAGIKFINKRFFVGLYSFYYEIEDLIERYLISDKIYTYGNVDKGRISGYELELEFYPVSGWKIFGNFFSFNGKSKRTRNPLNDIPPPRLFLGTRLWLGRFSAEIASTFQWKKKNPGPAEIEIPAYKIVNIKANYLIDSSWRLYLALSNFFNESYLARPDPDSVEEQGRNFVFGMRYSF
ncbi:MAG: TonB-dependent receptor [Candidatus Aminicenantes bacterium]|nr:MAG: TonB-dependent receptor [Candidatus Aminicenantes bacterium]